MLMVVITGSQLIRMSLSKTGLAHFDAKPRPDQICLIWLTLCGSSYINERFQDLITNRLRDEDYLRREGEDFSRVIDRLVVEFERVDKMVLDNMFPDHIEPYYLKVEGLQKNKSKHFRRGLMRLSK